MEKELYEELHSMANYRKLLGDTKQINEEVASCNRKIQKPVKGPDNPKLKGNTIKNAVKKIKTSKRLKGIKEEGHSIDNYRRILGSEDFQTIEEDLTECYDMLEVFSENKDQLDEEEKRQLNEWIDEYNYYATIHEANENKPIVTENDGTSAKTLKQRLGSAVKGLKKNIAGSKLAKNIQHSKLGVKVQKKVGDVVIDRQTKAAKKKGGIKGAVAGSNIVNNMKKKIKDTKIDWAAKQNKK